MREKLGGSSVSLKKEYTDVNTAAPGSQRNTVANYGEKTDMGRGMSAPGALAQPGGDEELSSTQKVLTEDIGSPSELQFSEAHKTEREAELVVNGPITH